MTVTDHSRATLAGSHSHGPAQPDTSRADRLTTFDAEAFGVPNGREENWRFSPVRELKALFADSPVSSKLTWTADLPAGVELSEIDVSDAQARSVRAPGDRASALASALAPKARLLTVGAGVELAEPVTIDVTGNGEQARDHLVLEVGDGAHATVVIQHAGDAQYSQFVSVDVADNASLNLVLLQLWNDTAVHAGEVVARIGRDGSLRGSVVTLGGKIVRLNSSVAFAGEGSSVDLFGLYFADAGQHQEHQLFVDHAVPKCTSRVTYKGALAGASARTVWIGDVLIRAAAEGTDTYELNRNLVLTDGARADSVPNLEIETGEIAGAGHASATGRFDEEQMFYLRSRGISETQARRLVVRGFFADVIREIGVPAVEENLLKAIDQELEQIEAKENNG